MKVEASTVAGRERAGAAVRARKPAVPSAWIADLSWPAAALLQGYTGVLKTDGYAACRSLADPQRAGGPSTGLGGHACLLLSVLPAAVL
jgi:hypothetical protein